MKNLFTSQSFPLQQPNFLKPRVLKRRSWKTLNILSTLAIVLNTGMVGVFLQPQTTQAATPNPTPVTNPVLGQACGLDIALVIDSSSSISNSELTQMKNAYKAFVDAFLPGTPTQMSVTEFDTTATVRQGFTNNVTLLKNAINSANSSGFTNWEDGLLKAWSTFDPRPAKQNLILFASDGNPNRKGTAGTSVSESAALAAAVTQANTFKTAGTRIVTLGIGDDLDVNNLKAISGSNVNTGVTSDVITTDFASLAGTLATLANQLCGGKILVQKQFDTNGDGQADVTGSQADPLLADWTFDVDGTPSNPAAQTTTNTGSLEFSVLTGTYSVTETNQTSGTQFLSAQCFLGTQPVGQLNQQTKSITGLNLSNDQTIACTFLNQVAQATLTVHKKVDRNADGLINDLDGDYHNPQGWTWDVVQGTQNNAGGAIIQLPAGTHTITEDGYPNFHATWLCRNVLVNEPDITGTGTSFTLQLPAGGSYFCAFTNTHDTGLVHFNKVVVGGAAQDTDFVFTTDGRQFTDGQSGTFLTGTYPLTESGVPGYSLTAASGACSLGQNGITLNVTKHGGTCTITNTRDAGTLIVHKDVVNPDGGTVNDTHNFTARVNGANPKTIAEGNEATYSNLATGTYTVTEDTDGNYTFVSFNHDLDLNTAGAQVSITKGQTTHLTITNKQKKATITISKDVRNAQGGNVADSTAFNVTSNAGNFSISENTPKVLTVNPGSYTFAESNPSNYTVHSTNPKTLTVASNGSTSYTFVNWQKAGSIAGKKFEDKNGNGVRTAGEDWLEDWKIYLDLNGNDRWDNGEPYDYTDHDGD
ncbi:MAG: VWA domain-containing protein, partial [Patescibacteria group bacterium]